MKPNKARLRLWVKALRSRKYTQAPNQLKSIGKNPSHCCLGVACEVFLKETKKGEWVERHALVQNYTFRVGSKYGHRSESDVQLPYPVAVWFGVGENPEAGVHPQFHSVSLADWNDDYGAGFHKIATLIEKEFKL